MGVGDSRPMVGSDDVGDGDPLIWTSAATKSELGRIRGVLDTINKEMSQAVTDGKLSSDEWSQWFGGVYTPAHKLTEQTSFFGWGGDVQAARQQEQAALKWRDLVKSRGGRQIGPADLGRKPSLIPENMKLAGLLVGGLVLVAVLHNKS